MYRDRRRGFVDESRGLREPDPFIDAVLDLPIREVQALEVYRDWLSIPVSLQPLDDIPMPNIPRYVRACGVVAVWTLGAPP